MNKSRIPLVLMLLTILGVTGFQLFWLKQTYEQEKKALALKTDFAFRETIREMQAGKLENVKELVFKKDGQRLIFSDTPQIAAAPGPDSLPRRTQFASVRMLTKKNSGIISGSIVNSEIMFSQEKDTTAAHANIIINHEDRFPSDSISLLLGKMDSLQSSLNLSDLRARLAEKMKAQHTNIPFTVTGPLAARDKTESVPNEVSVGFLNLMVYKLDTGNNMLYLLNRIRMPILFSLLLTVITFFSFFFLYRNLQKQRRLSEMKNEFIGNITHELKTPIATVSVALEALNDFNGLGDPVRTKEYLGIAEGELGRLSLLVDKVLQLSLAENKAPELHYENIDMAALIRGVLQSMQPQLEKTGAQTSFKLSGSDFNLYADQAQLSIVLYNLLDNAIKYSNGIPDININVSADPANVTITVSDTGIGIDPAYKEKIFEKFFRVPHGDLHNVKGYGLGLSYAASIIAAHKGTIRSENNGTNGTSFIIQLPKYEH